MCLYVAPSLAAIIDVSWSSSSSVTDAGRFSSDMSAASGQDDLCGLVADHDGWCVRVAADDRRHDRGVGNAEPVDAADLEVGPDDCLLVDAHPARPDAVVDGGGPVEQLRLHGLGVVLRAGVQFALDRAL